MSTSQKLNCLVSSRKGHVKKLFSKIKWPCCGLRTLEMFFYTTKLYAPLTLTRGPSNECRNEWQTTWSTINWPGSKVNCCWHGSWGTFYVTFASSFKLSRRSSDRTLLMQYLLLDLKPYLQTPASYFNHANITAQVSTNYEQGAKSCAKSRRCNKA